MMMVRERLHFMDEDDHSCSQCGRILHPQYKEELCPDCIERNLFNEVKDYIRNHDVNEADVAEHFGIPNTKVRSWIREGRIQYKNYDGKTISQVHCQICGKPLEFGNLCSECRHLQGLEVMGKMYQGQEGRMRFIDKDKK